ncbi:DeSI-like protein isoform E [Glycine soja]|uniref:DeSI-like protein isoform E n=1 Tax=Glycine soja TaxID=3848 RepID=A0A445KKK6_GLYSO|nr:DeSI-like protein isoform E [Glycine soja]
MPEFPLSSRLERVQNSLRENGSLVYLNVYDLTPANNYLYAFGVGIFHSGIEVHGMEYGFGAHEYPTSGIFEVEPRSCPGFIFRCSVLLGRNDMSYSEFRSFMERLSVKFHGDSYHLIAKNCNHFTDEVCQQLTGKPIPAWVNRLARVGEDSLCLIILIPDKLYFVFTMNSTCPCNVHNYVPFRCVPTPLFMF